MRDPGRTGTERNGGVAADDLLRDVPELERPYRALVGVRSRCPPPAAMEVPDLLVAGIRESFRAGHACCVRSSGRRIISILAPGVARVGGVACRPMILPLYGVEGTRTVLW
jgi:hypothetical protein